MNNYPITVNLSWLLLASFPGLPFFVLWFVFSIIHKNGGTLKNGEGLGTPVTWMTSGGGEVDVGGEKGSTFNNILDIIIKRFVARQGPQMFPQSLVRNLLSSSHVLHTYLLSGPPPYMHLASTSCGKCSQAYPIGCHSTISMYYRTKAEEAYIRSLLLSLVKLTSHTSQKWSRQKSEQCYIHVRTVSLFLPSEF